MNITGKLNMFVKTSKNGIKNFTTTISSKDKDNKYINMTFEVVFNSKKFEKEKIAKFMDTKMYVMEVEEGFITCRKYTTKDGNNRYIPQLFINKAKINTFKVINKKPEINDDDDLPF